MAENYVLGGIDMSNVKQDEYEVRKEKLKRIKEECIAYKDKYENVDRLDEFKYKNNGDIAKIA